MLKRRTTSAGFFYQIWDNRIATTSIYLNFTNGHVVDEFLQNGKLHIYTQNKVAQIKNNSNSLFIFVLINKYNFQPVVTNDLCL